MAELHFVTTADGSKTIFNPEIGENYHSKHGALQESQHVFVKSGLQFLLERSRLDSVSVLEVGFGTGLNFILTADYCTNHSIRLNYTGIEAFPLSQHMICGTGYESFVKQELYDAFLTNYSAVLKAPVKLSAYCILEIAAGKLEVFQSERDFDLIYFDAFAAVHQPEMWTNESLKRCCSYLKPGGVFVTYAITGNLKRIMKSIGFEIEKAPGAPGKREMLRAIKI